MAIQNIVSLKPRRVLMKEPVNVFAFQVFAFQIQRLLDSDA